MSQVVSFQDYARNKSEARPEWGFAWEGLVGLWVPRMGPTGATLFDLSGRGNHGVLTAMDPATDWVVSEKGVSLDFDGDNDYVALGAASALQPQVLSVVASVSFDSFVAGSPNISDIVSCEGTLSTGWTLRYRAGATNQVHFAVLGDGGATFATGPTLSLATWYHLVGTWDGTTARVFVDGVEGTPDVDARAIDYDEPLQIARGPFLTSRDTDGQISYVFVYNRALTNGEAVRLSREPLGLLVRQPRYYLFPEVAAAVGDIQLINTIDRDDIQAISSVPWADVEAVSSISKD